ncbi:Hypothetical predicted protein [Podarcis lilfordi]|uniref:Uncharacterized protein n=1 Tax=Podarcis lilfordi TaxID=74358 RepID=A0AA35L824_9SAUR|nr:Hypothetical predicted protein [Podarcis lilfordi]
MKENKPLPSSAKDKLNPQLQRAERHKCLLAGAEKSFCCSYREKKERPKCLLAGAEKSFCCSYREKKTAALRDDVQL